MPEPPVHPDSKLPSSPPRRGRAVGAAAPHRAPPKGRAEAAGTLLGCRDLAGRWLAAVTAGGRARPPRPVLSLSPSPCPVQGLGEGLLARGLSHFLSWRWGRGLEFPSDAGETTGPFNLQSPCPESVQEALVTP